MPGWPDMPSLVKQRADGVEIDVGEAANAHAASSGLGRGQLRGPSFGEVVAIVGDAVNVKRHTTLAVGKRHDRRIPLSPGWVAVVVSAIAEHAGAHVWIPTR